LSETSRSENNDEKIFRNIEYTQPLTLQRPKLLHTPICLTIQSLANGLSYGVISLPGKHLGDKIPKVLMTDKSQNYRQKREPPSSK
jgi:hypothetical protein